MDGHAATRTHDHPVPYASGTLRTPDVRNVIPVHEVGVFDDGVPYFTMHAVRGASFAQWLAAPSRAVGTAERVRAGAGILLEVCDAISYAHRRGVIHRDLKPENVMVGDAGEVYVIDWGLARVRTSADVRGGRAAEVLGVVGTPTHMAPEQARGNPVEMDERCDVFGLGCSTRSSRDGPRTARPATRRYSCSAPSVGR